LGPTTQISSTIFYALNLQKHRYNHVIELESVRIDYESSGSETLPPTALLGYAIAHQYVSSLRSHDIYPGVL